MTTKEIIIDINQDGDLVSWWTPEFEELISEVSEERFEERPRSPRSILGFQNIFKPELCG